jgi:hypothetical protein
MSQIIRSKLGIMMTVRTVELIRSTYANIDKMTLSYSISKLQNGLLEAVLGADHLVQPLAIHDEIAGMPLYWYTTPELFEQAMSLVFDKPPEQPTQLLRRE